MMRNLKRNQGKIILQISFCFVALITVVFSIVSEHDYEIVVELMVMLIYVFVINDIIFSVLFTVMYKISEKSIRLKILMSLLSNRRAWSSP